MYVAHYVIHLVRLYNFLLIPTLDHSSIHCAKKATIHHASHL